MRKVNKIVIHCTATKEGVNVSPATIKQWHLNRGFSDIGYHYIIGIEGKINSGRPVSRAGAHVKNGNSDSIGLAYVGGLDSNGKAKDTRTEAQKASLIKILKVLKNIYPQASMHGHRDYSPDKDGDGVEEHEFMKQCPCYNAEEEAYELGLQPKSFKPKTKKVKDKLNGKKQSN